MANNDSTTFLSMCVADVLGWKHLNGELVIDIGCGIGRTAKAVVDLFPLVRKVVAIDVSEERLHEAERYNSHPKIVYELADIRNKLSIARWVGEMDKAVSVFCFNCLSDVRLGYENMYHLLKPGGEAAIAQSLQSGYYDFLSEIKASPKWRHYFQDLNVTVPQSHFERHSADYYKKILEDVGFEVVDCYEEENAYRRVFDSDDDCKASIYNSCRFEDLIPAGKKTEFREDAFKIFLNFNKRNNQGNLMMTHKTFSAFLRKSKFVAPRLHAPK